MEEYSHIKDTYNGEQLHKRNKSADCGNKESKETLQQTRTPADKTRLNNLSVQLEKEIQEVKNESINSYLRELTNEKKMGDKKNRETSSPYTTYK
jgi:hypothetical protein